MAAPVINPVVILSTWYAFSGDVRIVLCRVGLGLLCAVLIGLTFSRAGKNGLSPSGSGWFSCACGCSVGQAAEGGKLSLSPDVHNVLTSYAMSSALTDVAGAMTTDPLAYAWAIVCTIIM